MDGKRQIEKVKMSEIILIYIAVINIVTYIIYGIDKNRAVNGRYRISEAILLMLAAVGGSLGAFLAMKYFRHKTKHLKFKLLIPIFMVLQVSFIGWMYLPIGISLLDVL